MINSEIVLKLENKEMYAPYLNPIFSIEETCKFVQIKDINDIKDIYIETKGVRSQFSNFLYSQTYANQMDSGREKIKKYKEYIQDFDNLFNMIKCDSGLSNVRNVKFELFSKLKEKKYTYNFFDLKMVKKNGKQKTRFICTTKKRNMPSSEREFEAEVTNFYKVIKNILSSLTGFEDNMLGVGLGVNKSIKYFDCDFDKIIKLDFKNFFNNVSNFQVYDGLVKNSEIQNESILKTLSLIVCPECTFKNNKRRTWQGLPTSSLAAYIALFDTFKKVKAFAKEKTGNEPVLYIDDFALPFKGTWEEGVQLKKEIMSMFRKSNFKINSEKSKLLYGNKKFFLGINMVEKKLGYNSYVTKLKAAINNLYHLSVVTGKTNKLTQYFGINEELAIKLPEYIKSRDYKVLTVPGYTQYATSQKGTSYLTTLKKEFLKVQGKMEYLKMINSDSFDKLMEHKKYGMYYSYISTHLKK